MPYLIRTSINNNKRNSYFDVLRKNQYPICRKCYIWKKNLLKIRFKISSATFCFCKSRKFFFPNNQYSTDTRCDRIIDSTTSRSISLDICQRSHNQSNCSRRANEITVTADPHGKQTVESSVTSGTRGNRHCVLRFAREIAHNCF